MTTSDTRGVRGSRTTRSTLAGLKVVSLLTLVSRISGLARDALMASLFGTGWVLDAFTVAFRIPNLFRRLFGEGAVSAALLPEFVAVDQQQGRDAASALFAGVALRLVRTLTVCVLVVEALLTLVWLYGSLTERNQILCELTMLLLPYAVLICVVAMFCAGLNAVHHFVIPAFVPVLLNVVWLTGGMLAAWGLADALNEIRAIAVCVLVGGVVQLWLAQTWAARYGIHVKWINRPAHVGAETSDRVRAVFRAMLPVLIGLSIMQVNTLIDSALAWLLVPESSGMHGAALRPFRLPEGTASALYLGQRLFQFPMGVFGVALSTVLFPRFAAHARSGDALQLNRDVLHGLQLVLVVGIPASAGLVFMATPITDLLFRYGQFSQTDALLTSQMIAAHGIGVWIYCGLLIVNRVFYAAGDQRTPMRQGVICVSLNLAFNVVLIPLCGGPGLALASVLATLVQLGLAVEVLRRRREMSFGRDALLAVLWRSVLASACMTAAGIGTLTLLDVVDDDLLSRGVRVVVPVATAVAVYWVTLLAGGLSPNRLLREPFGPDDSV